MNEAKHEEAMAVLETMRQRWREAPSEMEAYRIRAMILEHVLRSQKDGSRFYASDVLDTAQKLMAWVWPDDIVLQTKGKP